MELRILKYFLEVAKESNISRAADVLHMTQPTLSRQIRQLEEELGVTLFLREKHRIVLTEEGRAFYRRASEIVELVDRTVHEFGRSDHGLEGTLSIGCVETRSIQELGKIVHDFQQMYPHVSVNLHTALTNEIEEQMNKGLFDFGIMLEPVDVSEYYSLPFPEGEQWGVQVPENSRLAAFRELRPEDLKDERLIFPARALQMKDGLKHWFGRWFDGLHIRATYTLLNNAVCLAQQDVGAVICLNIMDVMPGMAFIPMAGIPEMRAALVWKKHQVLSQVCREFLFFCNYALNE